MGNNTIEQLEQYTVIKLPGSLLLHFETTVTWTQALWFCDIWSDNWGGCYISGWVVYTCCIHWIKGCFMSQGGRCEISLLRMVLFKIYKWFISEIFHLIFLDHGWLWVTETIKRKTLAAGD
jgi:hypothetical protein